jgi:acetyl esterase/lipase
MMHRVDPELTVPLENMIALTGGGLDLHDIPAVRAMTTQMLVAMKEQQPSIEGVSPQDRMFPGPEGSPEELLRIYQPTCGLDTLPALLWIHGGGYVLGNIESDDLGMKQLAKAVECVIVSVEYRLAPEHPFPAPLEDCYTALKWLAANVCRFFLPL